VLQGVLDGQKLVADLDDVLDRLLDPLPDAVGAGADLLGDLHFQQVVVEADDDGDEFTLLLPRHGCGPRKSPLGPLFTVRPGVRTAFYPQPCRAAVLRRSSVKCRVAAGSATA